MRPLATAALLLVATIPGVSRAQAPEVSRGAEPPPETLSAAVRSALAPERVTVRLGDTRLDFWWTAGIATPEGGAAGWDGVPAGALVGALRIEGEWTEIRGYTIRPGVYTLRFALQPQNGDHLGISPYREFLLLAPAADDRQTEPVGYEGAVDLSTHASRRSHPAAMSLDPPASEASPSSLISNEFGHDVVVFALPAAGEAPPITFGLVVRGTIEH